MMEKFFDFLYNIFCGNSNQKNAPEVYHCIDTGVNNNRSKANTDNKRQLDSQKIIALLNQNRALCDIINTTVNVHEFFGNLNLFLDNLLELSQYERTYKFTNSLPSQDFENISGDMESIVKAFIDRSYNNQLEILSGINTDYKHEKMSRFFRELLDSCNNTDEFIVRSKSRRHHDLNLFPDGSRQHLDKLKDDYFQNTQKHEIQQFFSVTTPFINESWEISVSFGKSRSSNFDKALYLAKNAVRFNESEYNGQKVYEAFYSSEPQSYLAFVRLYELVSGWKSAAAKINGELVDRKIIGKLNYCYGDKCRTGKPDFCYGASIMTGNPFGCHRLQMSNCNNPWWSFSHREGNKYIIDKQAILNRAISFSTAYRNCPSFNWDMIVENINRLPDWITLKQMEDFETGCYESTISISISSDGKVKLIK